MPIFTYKALNRSGGEVSGTIESESRASAIAQLGTRGLSPTAMAPLTMGGGGFAFFRRPNPSDILFFIRNFGVALSSGVTVLGALELLETDTEKPAMREMVIGVGASVRGGTPLSEAFVPYKEYFTPAFIGLLRSGEISGSLGRSLGLIAEYLRREFALKQRVKGAMVYPIILVAMALLVVVLLMVFVLPRLSTAFAQSGVELPAITKVVLAISSAFTYSVALDGIVVAALVVLFVWFRRTQKGKDLFAIIVDHTPIAAKVVREVALVRFTRTLGNLLTSGISMNEALQTTAESVGHKAMEHATLAARDALVSGERLSVALARFPDLFPSIVVGLVRVGEETGKLGEILAEVSEFYDEEVDYLLRNMTTLMEPILLLTMGLIVGFIAMSVLLPIYQLVTKVSG